MCIQHTLVCRLCEQSHTDAESPERSQKPPKNRDSGAFWGFPIWARSKVSDIWGRDPEKRPFFGPCAILRFGLCKPQTSEMFAPLCAINRHIMTTITCAILGGGLCGHVESVARGCDTVWGNLEGSYGVSGGRFGEDNTGSGMTMGLCEESGRRARCGFLMLFCALLLLGVGRRRYKTVKLYLIQCLFLCIYFH